MWQTWVHKQDETVEFEAREDGDSFEVRPVSTGGDDQRQTADVTTWRVIKETFLNIYERKV